MLKITKPNGKRVDIELDGPVYSEEMRDGLESLLAKSEGIEGGRMLYRIRDFAMPSWGAMMVEYGYFGRLFGMVSRFEKCAVLCDTAWLRSLAEWKGAFFPGLEVKAFDLAEQEAAEAWLGV